MYWNILVQIKNAEAAKKKMLRLPFSEMDLAVARILVRGGYIKEVKRKLIGKKRFLDIELIYPRERQEVLQFKIVSKPSRHVYKKSKELYPVRDGYGLGVISTSQGVMSGGEARKRRLGGEYLFEVW